MSIAPGNYVVDQVQPSLSEEERAAISQFHVLYYRNWLEKGAGTINLSWFGHRVLKCPLDLWMYQELLVRTRPEIVIETGTKFGGSALYLASVMDLLGSGRVITIDIEAQPDLPQHPRITYLQGSSTSQEVIEQVYEAVGSRRCMVVLDSDHHAPHVHAELIAYHPLVQVGDYLVAEDTNVNGNPAFPDFGPGPMEAVHQFLAEHDEFVVDEVCERFLMTLNPSGYLRRVK